MDKFGQDDTGLIGHKELGTKPKFKEPPVLDTSLELGKIGEHTVMTSSFYTGCDSREVMVDGKKSEIASQQQEAIIPGSDVKHSIGTFGDLTSGNDPSTGSTHLRPGDLVSNTETKSLEDTRETVMNVVTDMDVTSQGLQEVNEEIKVVEGKVQVMTKKKKKKKDRRQKKGRAMTAEEETRIKDLQQSQPAGEVEISSGQLQEDDFTSVAGMYNLRNNTTKLGDDFTGSVSCVYCPPQNVCTHSALMDPLSFPALIVMTLNTRMLKIMLRVSCEFSCR